MTWIKKDLLLFNILNNFGKKYLEEQIVKASSTFAKLKVQPPYVIFGYYSISNNSFNWLNNMNMESYKLIKKGYTSVFKSMDTVRKLCNPIVKLNTKYSNVIPYLLDIINAAFRVVRFKQGDNYVYALVKLEGLREIFNFDEFEQTMYMYRHFEALNKKTAAKK